MPPELTWDAATLAGSSGHNQDRVVVEDAAAGALFAVIDGATSDGQTHPDGGDYADALAAGLQLGIRAGLDEPRALLVQAIEHAVAVLALPAPSQPSAAVALAVVTYERASFAVLGDCTAAIATTEDGVQVLTDDRLAQVGRAERQALRACHEHAEASALHARLVQVERQARNSEGGYYIAADAPNAGRHALTREVLRPRLRTFMLATDGAAAGPSRYRTHANWLQVLSDTRPVAEFLHAIQLVEQSDPTRTTWPRSKVSDDKTAVRVKIEDETREP